MIDTRLVAELARELQIAKQEPSSPYIPFNRDNNPSAYPNGDDDEDGEDGEPVQLELPLAKKWGAIQHENGEWLMPTKEGTFRSATEEETIMLADADALTKTLEPHQNPRTGSLRGMPDEERRRLLNRGVGAHKA